MGCSGSKEETQSRRKPKEPIDQNPDLIDNPKAAEVQKPSPDKIISLASFYESTKCTPIYNLWLLHSFSFPDYPKGTFFEKQSTIGSLPCLIDNYQKLIAIAYENHYIEEGDLLEGIRRRFYFDGKYEQYSIS